MKIRPVICGGKYRAFMTVEAAFVIPFFILAFLAISSYMTLLQIEARIQQGMHTALSKAAAYTYFIEKPEACEIGGEEQEDIFEILLQGGVTAAYLHQKTVLEVGKEYLDQSCIMGGSKGLSVLGSKLPDEDGNLDFTVTYHVAVPILPGRFGVITVTQRECQRAWIGTKRWNPGGGIGEDETIVYVTENGSVYHTHLTCTYLSLGIQTVTREEAANLRSSDGSKYYACERCCKGTTGGTVYITKYGNRYHALLSCSSLKRAIRAIPLSEAAGLSCCSRCSEK